MTNNNKGAFQKRLPEIKAKLKHAIEKEINQLNEFYSKSTLDEKRKQLENSIGMFIKFTELDFECLEVVDSEKFSRHWFASQLAERFIEILGIDPTPTKGNDYLSILYICFECAGVVNEGAELYRYAKAGIDAISPKKFEAYKLLSKKERSIVESVEIAERAKKQSIIMKRNSSMKQTLEVEEKSKRK